VRVTDRNDRWLSGDGYESYIGRWSRLVARPFIDWLAVPAGARWLDVGCGSGALTQGILDDGDPGSVLGIDPSASFVGHARVAIVDPRVAFVQATAERTGLDDATVDAVVSGLVLNFVPDLAAALSEARRVAAPGGVIAGYVWDYAKDMELLRRFWDAAVSLDPAARTLDEAARFPTADPRALAAAFDAADLVAIEVRPIDVPTVFATFEDLWAPFLGATGPAPAYVAGLDEPDRHALRDRLRATTPIEANGSIHLVARAWAVRGVRPASRATG
jgi:SAM-dependent methyltransferase